jgi:hypothetical protein
MHAWKPFDKCVSIASRRAVCSNERFEFQPPISRRNTIKAPGSPAKVPQNFASHRPLLLSRIMLHLHNIQSRLVGEDTTRQISLPFDMHHGAMVLLLQGGRVYC